MQNYVSRPKSIKVGQGLMTESDGETRRHILSNEETAGALFLFHSRVDFGYGLPLQANLQQEKWFWVCRGHFDFHFGEECFPLKQGDFVFVPSNLVHAYTCTDAEGGELLCGAIGVESDAIYEDLESLAPRSSKPLITRAGTGEIMEAFGDCCRMLVDSDHVQGRFCIATAQTPSLSGPPLHVHNLEDETFFILSGRYEFLVDDARLQVEAGDVVWAPRGVPHSFRVVSNAPGEFLVICTPGGFDDFFRECMQLFQSGGATPDSLAQIGLAHQLRFIAPSI